MRLVVAAILAALTAPVCLADPPSTGHATQRAKTANPEVADMHKTGEEPSATANLLYARVSGQGDPVVFLAGLLGSERYWGSAFESLSQTQRLIYVDALGFGRSPKPDVAYTIDEQVTALHETLGHLGAAKHITFVAHSFGTVIAARYAAEYPDDVDRLILLGTPLVYSPEQARERIATVSPSSAFFLRHPRIGASTCWTHETFPGISRLIVRLALRDRPRDVADDSLLHTWPSFRGALQGLMKARIEALLGVSHATIIFVHGTSDTIAPIEAVSAAARQLGAALLPVSGGHHDYLRLHTSLLISLIGGGEPAKAICRNLTIVNEVSGTR